MLRIELVEVAERRIGSFHLGPVQRASIRRVAGVPGKEIFRSLERVWDTTKEKRGFNEITLLLTLNKNKSQEHALFFHGAMV